jgi:hypothetical protein
LKRQDLKIQALLGVNGVFRAKLPGDRMRFGLCLFERGAQLEMGDRAQIAEATSLCHHLSQDATISRWR